MSEEWEKVRTDLGIKEPTGMTQKAFDRFAAATVLAVVTLIVCGSCWAFPTYRVWQREMAGKAQLREAEWSRQIAVEEARARRESATLDAEAEVERAKGVAEANQIIGESLRGNTAYLRYLWVQGLNDGSSEVIYVPTEANLPIMEATRLDTEPRQP